jgi:uncharacterized ubiquitin-like protein YukD
MSVSKPRCVLCLTTQEIDLHHVGGRAFDFRLPLCHEHHHMITVGLRRLKVDTSAKAKHLMHAIRATTYFLFMLLDQLGSEDR